MSEKNCTFETVSTLSPKDSTNAAKPFKISDSLDENIFFFKELANCDKTIKIRKFESSGPPRIRAAVIYIDGLVNELILNQNVIGPILKYREPHVTESSCSSKDPTDRSDSSADSNNKSDSPFNRVFYQILFGGDIKKSDDTSTLFQDLLMGNTVLFVDGTAQCILISTKGWSVRAVMEPEAEKVITGPHEGFNESIIHNLALLRRKITNPDLKYEFYTIGKKTKTAICVCYMDGLADKNILKDLKKRINAIDIDCILDAEYIEEIIKDGRFSMFKTIGSTQRPDVAAAKLLEGRIAIIINGSPVAATLPFVFIEYFQAADDYYSDAYYASFNRMLRIIGFVLTISLPAVYLSMVTFHMEMLPLKFLMSATQSRNGMPFSSFAEIVILIFIFETIREGSSKIPASIGTAFSIVGGIVLGQASVEARFVSLPIVIIVAFTCITGMIVPELRGPAIFLRFMLLIFSRIAGMFGYVLGMLLIAFMICSLESFSIPYSSLTSRNKTQTAADTFIRMPWPRMKKRPEVSDTQDVIRQR